MSDAGERLRIRIERARVGDEYPNSIPDRLGLEVLALIADERALADEAAVLLRLAKARRPTLTLADIEAWLARYRKMRGL